MTPRSLSTLTNATMLDLTMRSHALALASRGLSRFFHDVSATAQNGQHAIALKKDRHWLNPE